MTTVPTMGSHVIGDPAPGCIVLPALSVPLVVPLGALVVLLDDVSLEEDVPLVVEFWAEACAIMRAMARKAKTILSEGDILTIVSAFVDVFSK